jgi:hypothetical protein
MVVVLIISGPLRRAAAPRHDASAENGKPGEMADLEAAREAKYREIRDADLDYRTGKLSDHDYQAVDQALRTEAIMILRAIDRHEGETGSGLDREA